MDKRFQRYQRDRYSFALDVNDGTLWVVWNSAATEKVLGLRKGRLDRRNTLLLCSTRMHRERYNNGSLGSGSNQISSSFWGSDTALPAAVQALFTGPESTTVGDL